MLPDVVELTRELVAEPTESARSNVALARRIAGLLRDLRFEVEELGYADRHGVDKLCVVARRGSGSGGLSLLTHSDTVPARAQDGWTADPLHATVRDGRLYGRGTCDMKGPLAAALRAVARFPGPLVQPLFFVVTADEEMQARGAREVVARSRLFDAAAAGCGIICEPTQLRVVNAHKGALTMTITARGKAAHTSTLKGTNANIAMIPFLVEMKRIYHQVLTAARFRNPSFTPPCSEWSLGICDHNPAPNMCPARSVCTVNYRPMPGIDTDGLIERTRQSARRHGLEFELVFRGEPVFTPPDSSLVRTALKLTGTRKPRSVAYGTDGLALGSKMRRMVVLGPGNIAQAHTVDEWVEVEQLRRSEDLYARFVEHYCGRGQD